MDLHSSKYEELLKKDKFTDFKEKKFIDNF